MDSPSPLVMSPKSPLPQKSPKPRSGLSLEDSPSIPKRRRLDLLHAALNTSYPPPFIHSPTDSPNPRYPMSPILSPLMTPERRRTRVMESPRNPWDSPEPGYLSTPTESPDVGRPRRYKKDELWKAIKPDYQYIMDGEIIEACKSTESDLSWDDDDEAINTKVSFAEFLQQYTELMDWCHQVQVATHGTGMSLSEKYLNQVYREEMLKQSPRKKCLTTYAKQLLRRYPNMKPEINARLQTLNQMWEDLTRVVMPDGDVSTDKMLKDLDTDLNELQTWLHGVETMLLPLCVRPQWGLETLEDKLRDHQALQLDIESHVRIVSAVLKLCERIEQGAAGTSNQLLAVNLERRWHAIWLQSLEWQCRLEYAINQKKGPGHSSQGWDGGYPFDPHALTSINFNFDHNISEGADSEDDEGDVLPFSEDEYEKIPVDTDTQTDGQTDERDEDTEHDGELIAAAEKMLPEAGAVEILSDVEEVDEAPPTEGKDGGYGSESHSNDELDGLKSESAAQTETVATNNSEVQTSVDCLERKMKLEFSDDGAWPNMDIDASPGEKFYKFVIEDSDSEKVRFSDSDGRACAKLAASTPKKREVLLQSPRTRLDILLTELEHVVEESSDYFQKDSRLSHLKTSDHEIRTEFSQKSKGSSERIQKLIIKAETLVETKWRRRNRRRTQTDSSAVTDDSCDASSEFTESDYSSAISDTEYVQPCLTSQNESAQTIVNSPQYASPVMRPRSNSSRKRERPHSYQETGDCEKFELRTFSISEGALADLREIKASNTTPRSRRTQSLRSRTRRIKRSRSDSERLGGSRSSSEKTVNGASGDHLDTAADHPDYPDGVSGVERMHTEDSDQLNSTVESFSETAWDDYQDPMYASVNDSYLEEKLDDHHLNQWDASSNLEFDDDFLAPAEALRGKRLSLQSHDRCGVAGEDSDSDLEDIKYVLEESRKQLSLADSVLRHGETAVQPHRYAEVVATCQTNLRCLQDVCDTLEQTDRDVTNQPNVGLFKEMISLWTSNYELAISRQESARTLAALRRTLQSVRTGCREAQELEQERSFQGQRQLEDYVRQLQAEKLELKEREQELADVRRLLTVYRRQNPRLGHVDGLQQQVEDVSDMLQRTSYSVNSRLHDVQSTLVSVYDYHETRRELAYCLEKEEALLAYLDANKHILDSVERSKIRQDLQTMLDDLHLYEDKLALLRRLGCDVISVSAAPQQAEVRSDTALLANQLAALRKRCHDNLRSDEEEKLVAVTTALPMATAVAVAKERASVSTQTATDPREPKRAPRYRLLKRLLRLALPVQALLLVVYGLLCLSDLTVSPQLRYVKGPPPF